MPPAVAPPPRPLRPRRAPTLYAKESGYYYALFYDGRRRPPRKWVALATKNERQARRLFAKMEAAWLAGTWDPWRDEWKSGKAPTLAEAIEAYAAERVARGEWRPKTKADRLGRLRLFAAALPPGLHLEQVREADVRAFVDRAPQRPGPGKVGGARNVRDPNRLSSGSRRTYHSILAAFFAWALRERMVEDDPMGGLEKAKRVKSPIVHFTPAQIERLLKELHADLARKRARGRMRGPYPRQVVWLEDVVQLALYTGLRLGELPRVRWCDVDLDERLVHVRSTELGRVKTPGSEAPVPLVAPALALLRRLQDERPNEDANAPVLLSPAPGPDGRPRPFSPGTAERNLKRYARLAGLPEDLSFQALRRSTGTWLLSRGVSLEVVQRVLRHESYRTTEEAYAELWDASVRADLDRAFGEPS